MAHDASIDAQARQDQPAFRPLPDAPRPRAETWRELRDEGIQWEGQVLLVGAGNDLPAFLVLTGERLVVASNGDVVLEAPRHWLTPEPRLAAGNGVRLWITPAGTEPNRGNGAPLLLRIRAGRGSAARLVGAISGRLVTTREPTPVAATDDHDGWRGGVGAASSVALPPLPDSPDQPASRRPWPPVEQDGVAAASPQARPAPPASISSWTAANLDTWPQQQQPAKAAVAYQAFPPAPPKQRRGRRFAVWGFRTLILALLIGAGVAYGQDYLPRNVDIPLPARLEERLGLVEEADPADVAQAPVDQATEQAEPTKPASDGTNGANNSDAIGTRDDSENGTGGSNGEITPADIGTGMLDNPPATDEPTPEPTDVVVPTGESTVPASSVEPTIEPTPEPTDVPATEEPAPDPTEVPLTPELTAEPTEVPVTPVPTEEPATEIPATGVPTEEPATEEPTVEPTDESTEAPATGEPTVAATEVPATESPTEEPAATLESQAPSVDPEVAPEQSLASGGFRFDITGASRGETITELPDLQPVGSYGEWVVLSLYGENTTGSEQVFDMSQFRIVADGSEYLLDVGNGWVGGQLGFTPAYGNTDAILWASGEGHEFALTFLIPPGTESLQLVAGDQVIDLTSTLETGSAVGTGEVEPALPGVIEATVVEVIDAETIVIEQDGIRQTVRYLGIDVPTGDDCLSAEAMAANAGLVEGQTVRIERQATDLDARGNWVRDVWAPTGDGTYMLVSQALVRSGLAEAAPSEPNTRFAGWLTGAQEAAQAEGAGMWSACSSEAANGTPLLATIPDRTRITAWRRG